MDNYTARASGSAGYEILSDGEVVAWTVDGWWAATIVGLLNRAEDGDLPFSASWNRVTMPMHEGRTGPPDSR